MLVQGGLTAPLILLGAQSNSLWLLIPALFIGFFGHIAAVVVATVTATSDVPDTHKGLASGLVTTSQRVAVTVGIPVLGAVMAIGADLLAGIQLALAADVVLTLTAVVIIWAGLNRSRPAPSPCGPDLDRDMARRSHSTHGHRTQVDHSRIRLGFH
jgi:predicted MFS family arabinose efflux permease